MKKAPSPLTLFRKLNGITQDELAAYLNVSRGYVSHIENKINKLSSENLEQLRQHPTWDTTVLDQMETTTIKEDIDSLRKELETVKQERDTYKGIINDLLEVLKMR